MAKIMVAMSGGVDSSLAAALLYEQGHEVVGVTLHLWDGDDPRLNESLCCSQEMTESARRVCAQLGIDYYVFNYQREFRRHVIEYFLDDYAQGYTPNPCMACNRDLKFRVLLQRAEALGYDAVATGHYARIVAAAAADGQLQYQLWRAVDHDKDQSYMLHMLGQHELARLRFPIGEYSKAQVRELAAARGLASADRPESQDICFVPGGDYRNLLREERPESLRPGPIVDRSGRELGQHSGLPGYTIGQRRGLGIAAGEPLYVTGVDVARNALVVGPAAELQRHELSAAQVTFVDGSWPATSFDCLAQIRSHAAPVAVTVQPEGYGRMQVGFAQPQRAVARGQAVVLYDGDRVLGGGKIIA
ncbi:MAG TPA: tRNA 2-thiouridine(34) synthase MnmA [Roseiflexaceae bacterium]|nr:tRNA 2-thiouridine(34) synthase MnmA [Roseiflexaceae bacterium]